MIKNSNNVCTPAIKYKKLKNGLWCRTWFTVEKDDNGLYFKQHQAFSRDRNADWKDWGRY